MKKEGCERTIKVEQLTKQKEKYFKRKQSAKTVYVFSGYNRSTKKYSAFKHDDVNSFMEFKKGTEVFVGFYF